MNTSLTLTKLLLCAGLFAATSVATSSASAGINRCVDAQGAVLLTDAECPQDSRVANDEVSDSGADGIILNSGVARLLPAAPVMQQPSSALPRSRWADLPRPQLRQAAGPDALTLQAARTAMQMQDELRRQGRMASR
ncbi:MAG TPA: DUF4124 domain-containing protein [Duganella sp.]|jgi:hypothetical protein